MSNDESAKMSDEIWVSSVHSDPALGNKLGIREKHYGEDWAPPQFRLDAPSPEHLEIISRAAKGEQLRREEFVEAAYVFDHKHWARAKDLFWVDGFLAVKGKLAELLHEFNLGNGRLVEFPIFEMDKVTPVPGPFFFLNIGAQKDFFVPDESRNVRLLGKNKKTGEELWSASFPRDEDIAVSVAGLGQSDLWVDPMLYSKIFVSARLHDALEASNLKIDFRFAKTRVLPG